MSQLRCMLEALSRDRSRTRRLVLGTHALAAAVGGGVALSRDRGITCEGAPEKLVGVWDDARRDAAAAAFAGTSKPYAADAWQRPVVTRR